MPNHRHEVGEMLTERQLADIAQKAATDERDTPAVAVWKDRVRALLLHIDALASALEESESDARHHAQHLTEFNDDNA